MVNNNSLAGAPLPSALSGLYVQYTPYFDRRGTARSHPADYVEGILRVPSTADLILDEGFANVAHHSPEWLTPVSHLWEQYNLSDSFAGLYEETSKGPDGVHYALPLYLRVWTLSAIHSINDTAPSLSTWQDLFLFCEAHKAAFPDRGCIHFFELEGTLGNYLGHVLDAVIVSIAGADALAELQTGTVSFTNNAAVRDGYAFVGSMVQAGFFSFTRQPQPDNTPLTLAVYGLNGRPGSTIAMTPLPNLAWAGADPANAKFMFGIVHSALVPANAKSPDTSLAFLDFLLSPPAAEYFLGASITYPAFLKPGTALTPGSSLAQFTAFVTGGVDKASIDSASAFTEPTVAEAWDMAASLLLSDTSGATSLAHLEGTRAVAYLGVCLEPIPSVAPGTFDSSVTVFLSSGTPGSAIHFTTDGSPPTSFSPVFDPLQPIVLAESETTTIRAVTVLQGTRDSPWFEGRYVVVLPVEAPSRVVAAPADTQLSDGAKAGIGLGAALAVLCIVAGAAFAWYLARKRSTVYSLSGSAEAIPFEEITLSHSIGVGSFGEVFVGEWRATQIAVKVLHRINGGNETAAAGSLKHSSLSVSTVSGTGPDNNSVGVGVGSVGLGNFPGSRGSLASLASHTSTTGLNTMSRSDAKAFVAEAAMLLSLRHPNVVTFMGVSTNPAAIVTEFCLRGSLDGYLYVPSLPISMSRRTRWASEIASGLAYIHESGTLHGDMKSLNVLLTGSWTAKICDFGLSIYSNKPTEQRVGSVAGAVGNDDGSSALGTLFWTAPEVLRGEGGTTMATDVYSMGIILYELFSRTIPYSSSGGGTRRSPFATVLEVMNGTLRPDTRALDRETPVAIRDLIETSWAHNPADRPSSLALARSLAEAAPPPDEEVPPPNASAVDPPAGDVYVLSLCLGHLNAYLGKVEFPSQSEGGEEVADVAGLVASLFAGLEAAAGVTRAYISECSLERFEVVTSSRSDALAFAALAHSLAPLDPSRGASAAARFLTPLLLPGTYADAPGISPFRVAMGIAHGTPSVARAAGSIRSIFSGDVVDRARAAAATALPGTAVDATGARLGVDDHGWSIVRANELEFVVSAETAGWTKWPEGAPDFAALYELVEEVLEGPPPIVTQGAPMSAAALEDEEDDVDSSGDLGWRVDAGVVRAFLDDPQSTRLGTGSLGVTVAGGRPSGLVHRNPASIVVFKKLALQKNGDIGYSVRFAREAYAVMRAWRQAPGRTLKGLVPVLGVCLAAPYLGYFTPFYRGGSVKSFVGGVVGTSLATLDNLARVVEQTGSALSTAMEVGLVVTPLSVRPGNVLLTVSNAGPDQQEFEVLLTDYGFLAPAETMGTMTVCQTAAYEAPELLSGVPNPDEEAVMVYALSMLITQIVNGRPPFEGMNAVEVSLRVLHGARPALDASRFGARARGIVSLVERMWSTDVGARPGLREVARMASSERCEQRAK